MMANVEATGEAVARSTATAVAQRTAAWLLEVDPAAQGVAELHALAKTNPSPTTPTEADESVTTR